MQTSWPGAVLPASNMVLEEVYIAKTLPLVLSDIPHVPLEVQLPAMTMGISISSVDALIWYAFDTPPGPIPSPLQASVVLSTAFLPGSVVFANQSAGAALPNDFQTHKLYLVSADASPLVYVTVLTQEP